MSNAVDLLKTRTVINIGAEVSVDGGASGTVFWISDNGDRLGFRDAAEGTHFVLCGKVKQTKTAPLPFVTRVPNKGQLRHVRSGVTSTVKIVVGGRTRWAPTALFLCTAEEILAIDPSYAAAETYIDGNVEDAMYESHCDSIAAARAERDYR